MKEKIFITGGAGFIGSHIVESLVRAGHEVTVYDNFSSGRKENLKTVLNDVKIIKGDILNYDRLKQAMKGHELVSHQAAQLEIFKCLDDPRFDLEVNTVGTINVLQACLENHVPRIINASSACVYGQAEYTPQDEQHPAHPNWPYGVSKIMAEQYGRIYMETHGLKIVNLRYGIVYGPREWYGRVLTMFLSRIYQKKSPVVFGDGSCLRDFVNVFDAVDFHNRCLHNEKVFGKSFNVGTAVGTSIRELAELVCRTLTDGKLKPIYEEVKEGEFSTNMPTRKRIPQELKKMVLSYALAKEVTGFQPKVLLRDGIVEEYAWLGNNPDSWDLKGMVKV